MSLEDLSKDDLLWAYQMDVGHSKAEIERLKAENADLRERLEKAVELPCTAERKFEHIADALIAAGMVDKSDYASMKETAVRYKAEVSKSTDIEPTGRAEILGRGDTYE